MLVDGRFSVAVALHACRVVAPAAFVLIHDYRDVENRGHEKAESCLELVEVAGTLGVFRRRDSVAHHEVEGLLREHHNITW